VPDRLLRPFFEGHPELSSPKAGKISVARSLFFHPTTRAEGFAAAKEIIGLYKPEEVLNTDGLWVSASSHPSNCLLGNHPLTFPLRTSLNLPTQPRPGDT
jgi:hypothetical protein